MIDADTASSPIIGRLVATGLHNELTGQAYAVISDDPRPTLVLANRSDIDLDRQVTAPGATWLDYRLAERERTPLAMSGFGREVRGTLAARAEHLVEEGLVQRQGPRILPQREFLATLRRREVDAVGARLSAETGCPTHRRLAARCCTYRQHIT